MTHMLSNFDALIHYYALHADVKAETPTHWVGADVILKSLITDELIQKYIKQDIPEREKLVEMCCSHFRVMRENHHDAIFISTTDSIVNVADAGRIMGGHTEIAEPASKEDIIQTFKTLRQLMTESNTTRFFVNPIKMVMPQSTLFSANESIGINFIISATENTAFQIVGFQEESITAAFIDFIKNIEESGFVYSAEESLAVFDSIKETTWGM
jgi:hypothetical protein